MGKLVSTDSLRAHPTLPDTIPALSEEELSDLTESLRTFGQKQDIVVDAEGTIIDGHNRWMAAKKLGWETVSVFPEMALTPGQAERLGIELNANRRHWSRDQRRKAVERLLVLDPERSDRDIARSAGVDHKTVAAVRAALVDTGEIPQSDKRTGADGRTISTTNIGGKPRSPKLPEKRVQHEKPEDTAAAIMASTKRQPEAPTQRHPSIWEEGDDALCEHGVPVDAPEGSCPECDRPAHPRDWATEDDVMEAGTSALLIRHEEEVEKYERRTRSGPDTAENVRRHHRRPVDQRIRILIAAAQDMTALSAEDVAALQTNDLMVDGLHRAIEQINRIIEHHNQRRTA